MSVALIVSATPASPLDSRPRLRLALSRALSRAPLIPASPCLRPRLPSPSLRLGLSRRLLVSFLVPEPLELLLEPRRVRVSPGLFQLPRLVPGLRKPPPLPSNNEKPLRSKSPSHSPQEPGLAPQSPRRPLGSPRTPPTHTHTHTRTHTHGLWMECSCNYMAQRGRKRGQGIEIRKQTLARAGTWENLSAPRGSEWPPRPLGDPKRGSG